SIERVKDVEGEAVLGDAEDGAIVAGSSGVCRSVERTIGAFDEASDGVPGSDTIEAAQDCVGRPVGRDSEDRAAVRLPAQQSRAIERVIAALHHAGVRIPSVVSGRVVAVEIVEDGKLGAVRRDLEDRPVLGRSVEGAVGALDYKAFRVWRRGVEAA